MFERGMEEKWLCINLLETIKLAVIYHGCGASQAIFFVFFILLACFVLMCTLK